MTIQDSFDEWQLPKGECIEQFATPAASALWRLLRLYVKHWITSVWHLFLATFAVRRATVATTATTVFLLHLESDITFDSLVRQGCECSVDRSALAVAFDTSSISCRRHSLTALSTNLPTPSAICTINPMLDSTDWTIISASLDLDKVAHFSPWCWKGTAKSDHFAQGFLNDGEHGGLETFISVLITHFQCVLECRLHNI